MEQNYSAKQERHLVKSFTLRKDNDSRNCEISLVLRFVTRLNLPRNPVKGRIGSVTGPSQVAGDSRVSWRAWDLRLGGCSF